MAARARAALAGGLLVLTVVSPATRAADGWSTGGPFGGSVADVAVHPADPTTIFASTTGGLFKSRDRGKTWARSSRGMPPDAGVSDIEFAPSRPATMYATTGGGGIFRSVDGGESWTSLHHGSWYSVAASPSDPDLVLAASSGALHRSTNGGQTWSEISPSGWDGSISPKEVVFAPSDPAIAYASEGWFWRSTDGGLTWTEPMSPPSVVQQPGAIAVHPTQPSVVYVAEYSRIWKSSDGGATWRMVYEASGFEDITSFDIDERSPNVVYASTYSGRGVLRTRNGGDTWERIDEDLPREVIWDIELDETSGRLYAGLFHLGFFRSKTGARWSPSNDGLVGSMIGALDFAGGGSRVAYAAVSHQGVARSNDGGGSWRFVKRFRGPSYAIAAASSRRVFVGTQEGVYRTTDGGRSWTKIRRGLPNEGVAALEATGRRVYVGFRERRGFWRSDDGGRTWRRTLKHERFYEIVASPKTPRKLVALSSELGIRFSNDGGRSWLDKSVYLFPEDITISAGDPDVMLAGVQADGVWKSTDAGKTWRQMSGDDVSPDNVQAVAVDPKNPRNLFAGAYSGEFDYGMFRSTDGGRTWRRMEEGLTTTWITSLALDDRGRNLIAGTTAYGLETGGGAFVYRLR